MLPRPCNGRRLPLVLLVATMAALPAGCSVTTQPAEPSWWATPWPYFLSSALALLAGAVLWFIERQIASRPRNRLGRLEKQAFPSDKQLDNLKQSAQQDRIDHVIDRFAQTQAAPTSEVVETFGPRSVAGEPANEGASDDEKANGTEGGGTDDGATSDGAMQVEVNIFAIGTGRGQPVEENLVVVQRVIERAIAPDDAGETDLSAYNNRETPLTEQEPGPFEKAAADSIVDPAWERVEQSFWMTRDDYQSIADGAKWVAGVENGWHDLVLGKPAERVALGAGFSLPSAEMMGVIAAKIGLPGDNAFKDVRRLVQCTGIVLGVASGAAPLANACIKSLAHDLLAELMAKAFREAIGHVLEPVCSVECPIPAHEIELEGARAQQLHSDLVAAEFRQKAHELEMQEPKANEWYLEERWTRWADGPSFER